MTTPHVIASSSGHHSTSTASNGMVGTHFRVGKKIGEGSFGVVFEGLYPLCAPLYPVNSVTFVLNRLFSSRDQYSLKQSRGNQICVFSIPLHPWLAFSDVRGVTATDLGGYTGTSQVGSPSTPG